MLLPRLWFAFTATRPVPKLSMRHPGTFKIASTSWPWRERVVPPAGEYQFNDQVSDLAQFVDQLGLLRFTLIGTSMGGIIAMAYAGAHPERLMRLIVNDIGPDAEAGRQRITQTVGSRPDKFATLDDAMAYRRQAMPVMASRSAEDQRELALGVLRERPDGWWVWKMDPAYVQQRMQHGAPPRPSLWPVLQRLPCPTLVVWKTQSDLLSEGQARRLVEVLPGGELVAVPGVGHAPTLVEPVALAALERFLNRQNFGVCARTHA